MITVYLEDVYVRRDLQAMKNGVFTSKRHYFNFFKIKLFVL